MFLTAREIVKNYRAIDGDRDPRVDNDETGEPSHLRLDSDAELYDRKYSDATVPQFAASTIHGAGLADELRADKYNVRSPIPLQVPGNGYRHRNVSVPRRGQSGDPRPQVLNGHHRIAVMLKEQPDKLMPVEHYDSNFPVDNSMADTDVSKRLAEYRNTQTALFKASGVLSVGKPRVPGPWPVNDVDLTQIGIVPRTMSDDQINNSIVAMVGAREKVRRDIAQIKRRKRLPKPE